MKAKHVMNRAVRALIAAVLLSLVEAGAVAGPKENKWDALAKTLGPFLALGTPAGSAGNHAVSLQATVVAASNLPPEYKGARLQVAFEFPDKLLIQMPLGQTLLTICRNGQEVWAYPAPAVALLLDRVGPKKSPKPLPAFRLSEAEATLLPALLDVHDAGEVALGEQHYRVLDVRLLSQIKTAMSGWYVRLWIQPETHRAAQLAIHAPGWAATGALEKVEFVPALPRATWQPTPNQEPATIRVPPEKVAGLVDLALLPGKIER